MPNTFTITNNGQTYTLQTDGTIQNAGTPWGKWAVNSDNSVTLTPTTGNAINFAAAWSFLNNDLMVALTSKPAAGSPSASGGTSGGGTAPASGSAPASGGAAAITIDVSQAFSALDYSIDGTTGNLVVGPTGVGSPGSFTLAGTWGLTSNYNLQFTPKGGTASVINGRVNDSQSRFRYRFSDTANENPYDVVFPGQWSLNVVNADIQILFTFPWNDSTGQKQVLKLTEAELGVDSNSSLLQVTYNSGGSSKGWQILLVGNATITNGTFLTYELIDQNGNLTGTKFDINAKVGGNLDPGTLDFSLQDQNGKWVPVLSYTGQVSVGTAKGNVAFTIKPESVNESFLPINIDLTGSFSMNNGADTVQITANSSGLQLSFSTGDITFGKAGDIWATVSVIDTGGTVGFSALFGFSI